ncbi:MAG: ATP-dependent Clp protease proteolytic subunit [Loktanella sp.]|nr:ATP-dependent Clp protease proteolytic subunit [Loktanella sp.]
MMRRSPSSGAESVPDDPPAKRRARSDIGTARILLWVLGLQLVFAVILLGSDIARILPQIAFPSTAPQLTQPVGPGDQTRRFDPTRLPQREAVPDSRPLPSTDDMPSRLLFEATTWNDAPALTMTGQIAPGDAARFADFIETQATPPEEVYLNSPGGSVDDALAIGRQLRTLEVLTALSGADVCMSACPYILAAGTRREVAPDALVGVHQHYFGENVALPAFLAVADIQRGQGEVMTYLDEMGVDPLLMTHALATPPDEIYVLTPEQLALYGLTTDAD